jgi:molybdopterin-containing oxidoreductase family iron-sulfur binding subunit
MKDKKKKESRRDFLKLGLGVGAASLASIAGVSLFNISGIKANPSEKIKVLTQDGKLLEVEKSQLQPITNDAADRDESKQGLPNRKFVMVIDLAKCKNARKCITACQEGHHLPVDQEWIKVYLLQDSEQTAPYWFPRPCFHCDNPLCVSVCPVGATYKRSDGIVLVDNQRCIGCKFCMTGCPFSARQFNWRKPERDQDGEIEYSPETNIPAKEGTVGKCVFCADKLRKGELPRCVSACPMGVIYFGDMIEDTVTNGTETVRFAELLENRSGYRKFEELGTEPSVYYLPPVERQFPVDRGFEGLDKEDLTRYKDVPYIKKLKENESGI